MKKTTWIPLAAGVATMAALFLLGYLADLPYLMFKIGRSNIEVAFFPIIVGFIVSFVSEKALQRKKIS
ncbi:ATPase [Bacillus salacetis]|uniref:ATPase n=1 Tax=Bacillus salacetis TaxID=2315464 RepID=A0A3A1QU50_9BACI|nr:ATPase [Bacillus salacetis]RIW30405.1 ATPase [Bacillus salacetis]